MEIVQVSVEKELSFFHVISENLTVQTPKSCNLPHFFGMSSFAPIISLNERNIKQKVNEDKIGVYIILLWFPWEEKLFPVYVGKGPILKRLSSHVSNYEKKEYATESTTPKFFYKLLNRVDKGYWMVTWSSCESQRIFENEIYHYLNDNTPYLVNAIAPISDERSKSKNQEKKAEQRFEKILDEFFVYTNFYSKNSIDKYLESFYEEELTIQFLNKY